MIRRDYILRMIEQFIQALARIASLSRARQYGEAETVLDKEFAKLVGSGAEAVAQLSETELMARIVAGEPTQVVRDKCFLLVALLKEAAALHAAQGRKGQSQACYLKALNLLLETRLRAEDGVEVPSFAPSIEELVALCGDAVVPAATRATLMQHYERLGDFARAEDQLFAILESAAYDGRVLCWGITFYERLLGLSDTTLSAGNLPRAEVEAGVTELRQRASSGGISLAAYGLAKR
ncbi:MAG: hypothetical protein FJ403_05710 [Verrucomicrobia bacterium]|nr:hypothetical protein [Verrucomicrobiota bacterium]